MSLELDREFCFESYWRRVRKQCRGDLEYRDNSRPRMMRGRERFSSRQRTNHNDAEQNRLLDFEEFLVPIRCDHHSLRTGFTGGCRNFVLTMLRRPFNDLERIQSSFR